MSNNNITPSYYVNSGRFNANEQAILLNKDTVRPMVMRNGVMVDIKEHNEALRIGQAKKGRPSKYTGFNSRNK